MTPDELKAVLADHQAWLADNSKGKKANLGRANLRGADLGEVNLGGAYLGEANLRGAYLGGAYLCGTYLGSADLGEANLDGANLRGAYLGRANLRGANLRGTYLGGADLRHVHHVINLGFPDGWDSKAYEWESAIWVRVGCRTFSITEGRAYWAGKDNRREVLVALDYAETIAKLRGWEIKQ